MPLPLPDEVLAFAERGPAWAAYVDGLPVVLRDLLAAWELRPGPETWHGFGSVVLPVTPSGSVRGWSPPGSPMTRIASSTRSTAPGTR